MRHDQFYCLAVLLSAVTSTTFAQAPTDEGVIFFEQKIRPVLVQYCYSCHSVEAQEAKKLQGGLFLDSAAGTLTGGETGPALVKGKSAESRLIKALKYDGMENSRTKSSPTSFAGLIWGPPILAMGPLQPSQNESSTSRKDATGGPFNH